MGGLECNELAIAGLCDTEQGGIRVGVVQQCWARVDVFNNVGPGMVF